MALGVRREVVCYHLYHYHHNHEKERGSPWVVINLTTTTTTNTTTATNTKITRAPSTLPPPPPFVHHHHYLQASRQVGVGLKAYSTQLLIVGPIRPEMLVIEGKDLGPWVDFRLKQLANLEEEEEEG